MSSEQKQAGDQVYRTQRFDVYEVDLAKRNGGKLRRGYIKSADAVVILPVMEDGKLILIRNQRFALGKELWELPAGTVETGEDLTLAAGRELAEETGYKAEKMERLCAFYACPGMVTEKLTAFQATGLTWVGQQLDETEKIVTEALPISRTMEMIQRGDIEDAKTISTILYWERFCGCGH
ncbi:NUDIX hydrolase [Poriferisphaera sp. WC338]|uniref:NUDIX hydrolase n=1 Tax=Poriferisphaera sp. WC338 TaxID=3425129 RepID=UPI003D818F94